MVYFSRTFIFEDNYVKPKNGTFPPSSPLKLAAPTTTKASRAKKLKLNLAEKFDKVYLGTLIVKCGGLIPNRSTLSKFSSIL